MAKKIHYKNDFELCYLRHQYLRRTDINPTKEDLAPFSGIIHKLSGKNYSVYQKLLFAVGLHFEDLVRASEVHLVSYLGLFRIEKDEKKFAIFTKKFVDQNHHLPSESDILDKNRADFTTFLKQRMEDMVRICRQKVRNVRGTPMQAYHFFFGATIPSVTNYEILARYEKHGLKKVDPAVFRAIKKKANPANALRFFFNGNWYISIPTNFRALEYTDFIVADQDPRDLLHNKNPEELVIMSENSKKMDIELRKITKYKKIASKEKIDMLKSFISTRKNDSNYQNEVRTAVSILSYMEK